jgi:TolC family type I secretion outer membrane protein
MIPASKPRACLFALLLILAPAAIGVRGAGAEMPQTIDLAAAGRIALAGNPSLAAAAARVEAAAARVRQARAAYWPRLDAAAGLSRIEMADSDYRTRLAQARVLDPSATLADPQDFYESRLTASWTVFDGFARRFALLQAGHGRQETAAARDEARRLLLEAVSEAFHGVQLAREAVAVAEADAGYNGRLMEEARIRREVGTGSLSDVLNFEVGVNAARSEVISARRQQHEATAGLAALLGFPAGRLPDGMVPAALAPETTAEMTIPEADAEIAYALARRPDLTQRAEALQAAEAGLGAARSGFWPTVRLAASLDGDRANDGRLRRDDFGDSVTLSLSYTLFAGGYHRARVAEARQNQAAATKELESRRQGVAAEIVQALADIEASTEQLRLQRRNAELVQRHRDLVEKEYAVGQVSLVRLNEAQRNLVQAQGRLAQARVALQQARFTLDTATGRSLERFAR